MGLFEDFSRFLETRLEEFMKNNPHLELQALEEQLQEQEEETLRLITSFRLKEKQLKDQILETAQEVKRWHLRIQKAESAKRLDLAAPAREREAQLLRQGNQLWGQMTGIQDRIQKTIELQQQIQTRRKEVKAKIAAAEATRQANQAQKRTSPAGWDFSVSNPKTYDTGASRSNLDPLEESFQRWETEEELEQMKRDMGK
ncbi:MAG: TIGR04376 family protein [Cyanobacteria bacterium J06626_14]